VDIMAWAFQVQAVPVQWQGPMMEAFQKLDYVTLPNR
jgi:antitoxin CptB